MPRAKEGAKILWCGTRWSLIDPAGLRMDLLENDEKFRDRRYEIINLPALNEKDESNFDYPYGVGFSTDYYHQRRASFERNNDMASWTAQYMCEPIERSGALFEPDDMRYYNGELLPLRNICSAFQAVERPVAAATFVAAPFPISTKERALLGRCGDYSNGNRKTVTQPLIADKTQAVTRGSGAGY